MLASMALSDEGGVGKLGRGKNIPPSGNLSHRSLYPLFRRGREHCGAIYLD
jgi:hypothetical protein